MSVWGQRSGDSHCLWRQTPSGLRVALCMALVKEVTGRSRFNRIRLNGNWPLSEVISKSHSCLSCVNLELWLIRRNFTRYVYFEWSRTHLYYRVFFGRFSFWYACVMHCVWKTLMELHAIHDTWKKCVKSVSASYSSLITHSLSARDIHKNCEIRLEHLFYLCFYCQHLPRKLQELVHARTAWWCFVWIELQVHPGFYSHDGSVEAAVVCYVLCPVQYNFGQKRRTTVRKSASKWWCLCCLETPFFSFGKDIQVWMTRGTQSGDTVCVCSTHSSPLVPRVPGSQGSTILLALLHQGYMSVGFRYSQAVFIVYTQYGHSFFCFCCCR